MTPEFLTTDEFLASLERLREIVGPPLPSDITIAMCDFAAFRKIAHDKGEVSIFGHTWGLAVWVDRRLKCGEWYYGRPTDGPDTASEEG